MAYVDSNIPSVGSKFANEVKIDVQYTENILKGKPIGIEKAPQLLGDVTHSLSSEANYGIKFNNAGTKLAILNINGVTIFDVSSTGVLTNPVNPSLSSSFNDSGLRGGVAWSEDDRFIFIGASSAIGQNSSRILILEDVSGTFTEITGLTARTYTIEDIDYRDEVLYVAINGTSGTRFGAIPFNETNKTLGNDIALPNQPAGSGGCVDVKLSRNGTYQAYVIGTLVEIFEKTGANTWVHRVTATSSSAVRKCNWLSNTTIGTTYDATPYYRLIEYDNIGHTVSFKPNQNVSSIPTGATGICVSDSNYFTVGQGGGNSYVYSVNDDTTQDQVLDFLGTVNADAGLKSVAIKISSNAIVAGGFRGGEVRSYRTGFRATELDSIADARNTVYTALGKTLRDGNTGETHKVTQFLD